MRKERRARAVGIRGAARSSRAKASKRSRSQPIDSAAVGPVEIESLDFGPLADRVGYRIRRAYGRVFQTFNQMFEPLNIAFGQYSVLELIEKNPGVNQMSLAEASGIDRTTVVPIINRFVRLGWVRRTRRTEDRRMYSLRVTAAGQAILDRALSLIEAHEQQLVRDLSPSEREQLVELLARVSDERIPALRPKVAAPPRPK